MNSKKHDVRYIYVEDLDEVSDKLNELRAELLILGIDSKSVSFYVDDDDESLCVSFWRDKTDEEILKEQQDIAKRQKQVEERELKLFKELQAKYGG